VFLKTYGYLGILTMLMDGGAKINIAGIIWGGHNNL